MATNIINSVRHIEGKKLWTWSCSCGARGQAYYSAANVAITAGRRIHGTHEMVEAS